MATKRTVKVTSQTFKREDLSSWNFILFLLLAFILLVVVVSAMKKVGFDLRSRAGLTCETPTLPRVEDCPGGKWTLSRDTSTGCEAFFCEAK
jgi:hypothetical protein